VQAGIIVSLMPSSALDVLLLDAVRAWFIEDRLAVLHRLHPVALRILSVIHSSRIEGSHALTGSQLIARLAPEDVDLVPSAVSYLGQFASQSRFGKPVTALYVNGPISINVKAFQSVSVSVVKKQRERLEGRGPSALASLSRLLCPPQWLTFRRDLISQLSVPAEHIEAARTVQRDLTPRKLDRNDRKRCRLLSRASSSCSKEPLGPSINGGVSGASQQTHCRSATFVEDPCDNRLSVCGALVDRRGRLDLDAYKDLKPRFSREPALQDHPDPLKPGMQQSELYGRQAINLDGLRIWSDAKGEGWHVHRRLPSGKTESRWMSAITWGSWRLAFLLARLQRDIWMQRAAVDASS